MANLTRAQRAAKEAASKPTVTVSVPSFAETQATPSLDEIPVVSRETLVGTTARNRIDPREYAEKIRATRKDFSGLEQKMKHFGENPGWKRRWVNEDNVPGRLEEGYRFVQRDEVSMSDSLRYGNSDIGDRVSVHAGKNDNGHPFNAYLMEIPQEIADELDEAKSHKKVRSIEQSIRAGTVGNPTGNDRVGAAAGLPEIKLS